jgi:hypothetical protein
MGLKHLLGALASHSRTPVPKNVEVSIRDWAHAEGLLSLSETLVLSAQEPESLARFLRDPGTRRYVGESFGERSVQLRGRVTPRRMQSLLRELGFLIELGDAP